MSPAAPAARGRRVLFLDDDPAVRMLRALTLPRLPAAMRQWLDGYIWPEVVPEPDGWFAALRSRAAWPDDLEGFHAQDVAALDPDLREAVVAVVFRRGRVEAAWLDVLPALRVIQRFGDTVPEVVAPAAARIAERGIVVRTFRRRSLVSVAEHALALLLAAKRRLRELDAAARSGTIARPSVQPLGPVTYNWTRFADVPLLDGSRAGIVGLGEIGSRVARMLQAFGADVVYCNRRRLAPERERELGVRYAPLPALLAESDSVILAATPPADGAPIMGAAELAAMRPSAVLVNVGRGALVDEPALVRALESGRIAGAGLDVYAQEPLAATSPLVRLPNAILTPHVAGQTRLRLFDEVGDAAAELAAALAGRAAPAVAAGGRH